MKRSAVIVLGLAATLLISSADSSIAYKKVKCFMPQTPEVDLKGVTQIAILDFKGKHDSGDTDLGQFIADQMISMMLKDDRGIRAIEGGLFGSDKEGVTYISGVGTKVFSIVERSRLESVLGEQEIGDLGLIQGDQAAKMGEILGAQVLITGGASWRGTDTKAVEVHSTYKNKQEIKYNSICTTRNVTASASIRIVDARTGEILTTRSAARTAADKVCDDQQKTLQDAGELAGLCGIEIAEEFVNLINPWYALEEFEMEKIKAEATKKEAEEAAKLAENRELEKAYAIYSRIHDADPYDPCALYNIGVLLEVTGDFEAARGFYTDAASMKDEKSYKEAVTRVTRRATLVPFYASLGMAIVPRDLKSAAENPGLSATKVKTKGSSSDRIDVYAGPDGAGESIVKVPGDIQLEVIEWNGDWCHVRLLGGKDGFINKTNLK